MKMISRKVLTTTIAASVLLGGGVIGLLQTNAFADTPTAAKEPTDQAAANGKGRTDRHMGGVFEKRVGFGGGNMLKETAAILGTDEQSILEKVKAGQTLLEIAQAAGVTEDVFLQKLTAAMTKTIDDALSEGKITQEQADKLESGLADRLKQSIANQAPVMERGKGGPGGPGKMGGHGGGPGGLGGPGRGGELGYRLFGNADALAAILGMTKEELKAAQLSGKSLAEIAQEKGITEDALIGKLKDAMTDQLKQFVEHKPQLRAPQQEQQQKSLQQRQRPNKDQQQQQQQSQQNQQQKLTPAKQPTQTNA